MPVATATHTAPFVNEPYTDFSKPDKAAEMRSALAKVRSEFGKEYDLLIAGDRRRRDQKLESVNPAKPSEVIGVHQKGTEQDARDAVEAAWSYFPTWAAFDIDRRAELLFRVADIFRER